ncbi:MAG: zinc metallopeptidase [Planctomycetes bacterium]|nr:zinc metallopeptidase [Planctomycetota bacterium]MCG2685540.1 zinc metallopeptidase [Planctomycetales bacterium]
MIFDPMYFLWIAPAVLLGMWAQFRIRTTYAQAQRMGAPLSGAAAARHILDSAGLNNVDIEQMPGHLSDHYDPRAKVLRLSPEVYQNRTLASVGIAAHEAGHAIQHAHGYAPLVVRNAAVPLAGFGSNAGFILLIIGAIMNLPPLILLGIGLFAVVVVFQVVNLPVEFNASSRAKAQLVGLGIVNDQELTYVNKVLNAAALTYVAATLQAILTLLYYVTRFGSRN